MQCHSSPYLDYTILYHTISIVYHTILCLVSLPYLELLQCTIHLSYSLPNLELLYCTILFPPFYGFLRAIAFIILLSLSILSPDNFFIHKPRFIFISSFIKQEKSSVVVYNKDYACWDFWLFKSSEYLLLIGQDPAIFIFVSSFMEQENLSAVVYTKDYACRLFSTCCKVGNIRLAGLFLIGRTIFLPAGQNSFCWRK